MAEPISMADASPDAGGDVVWCRRLDVRVRRVAGKLALRSPSGAVAVPSGSTWLWTALDGRSTLAELCDRAGVDVAEVAATFKGMVDAGVVEPASSRPEDEPSGDTVG